MKKKDVVIRSTAGVFINRLGLQKLPEAELARVRTKLNETFSVLSVNAFAHVEEEED